MSRRGRFSATGVGLCAVRGNGSEIASGRAVKGRSAIRRTTDLKALRDSYGLDDATLARLVGVSETTLPAWGRGAAMPEAAAVAGLEKAEEILKRLALSMEKDFIAAWLSRPNDACGGRAPIDLLREGEYETVGDLAYVLGAGEPV